MGNSGSQKPIGGLVSGITRPGIRLRAPNYEVFLKISINLRTRSFSSDNLPQKTCESRWLLNEGVTDLNFPSANVVQVRHCRDNKGVTICGTSATVLL